MIESSIEVIAGEGTDTSRPETGEMYHIGRAWYALVVLEIQALAIGIDFAIVTLLVHPIETAFRINDVGFAASTAMPIVIGYAVAYYPAGLLADTFHRRYIIATGAAIWALAALVAARADSGAMLFVARFLAGIGSGLPWPAIFSVLSDAFPRTRRAFALSLYWASMSIGTGVGLSICGALVAATQRHGMVRISGMFLSPWQQCFVACAAMGIVVLALVLTIHEPPRMDRSTHTNANLTSSLRIFGRYLQRHWLLWALLLLGGTIGATSYMGVTAWGPTFGMRHYGITGASSIALLGTFVAGGSLVGSIVGGLLAQRGINHGDPHIVPRMLVTISAISCAFAISYPFMPSWLLAVVGIGGVNATWIATVLLMQTGIMETAPNEVRGQLFGLWGFIGNLSSSAVATLVAFLASGVFAKAGGLGPALTVVGGTTCAIALLLFAFSSGPYARAKSEI